MSLESRPCPLSLGLASHHRAPTHTVMLPVILVALLLAMGLAGAAAADDIEVRIAQADGFSFGELEPVKPIVMFPVSAKVTTADTARRLSASMGREASTGSFVDPAKVQSLITSQLMSSAYDSLVTTMSSVQPATSLRVLDTVASRFKARHALVPINIAIDEQRSHYGFDIMFVLVDLKTGRPRIIMSAGDALDGDVAGKRASRDDLESRTLRAILTALRAHG
jgi:hypothetical protein